MFSDHNEGNSVVAERFIRTLKSKIFKNITTDGIKFCSRFLNKLVGECNNTFILSSFYWQKIYWSMLSKIYFDFLTDEIVLGHKASKFKVGDTNGKN